MADEYIDPNATIQDTIQNLGLGNPRNVVLTFEGLGLVPAGSTAQALTSGDAPIVRRSGPFPWWLVVAAVGVMFAFSKR